MSAVKREKSQALQEITTPNLANGRIERKPTPQSKKSNNSSRSKKRRKLSIEGLSITDIENEENVSPRRLWVGIDDDDASYEDGDFWPEDAYNAYLSDILEDVKKKNDPHEHEEILFEQNAKLFEYRKESGWIIKGMGTVRFAKNLKKGIMYGVVRMFLGGKPYQKPMIDQIMEPGIEATAKDKSNMSYVWMNVDYSQHSSGIECIFGLKFESEAAASKWKEMFEWSKTLTLAARTLGNRLEDTEGKALQEFLEHYSIGHDPTSKTANMEDEENP